MAADTEATSLGGTEYIQEYSKLSGTLERLTYTQQTCKSIHCSIIWKPMAKSQRTITLKLVTLSRPLHINTGESQTAEWKSQVRRTLRHDAIHIVLRHRKQDLRQ